MDGMTPGTDEDQELEAISFTTKMLGQQRTMAKALVQLADGLHDIAKAYEATQLDVEKIREKAYQAGREDALTAAREDAHFLLGEVLASFVEKGHLGEPCQRSGWVAESTIREWRLRAIDLGRSRRGVGDNTEDQQQGNG